MGRKIHKSLILLLSVLLCVAMTSCMALLSTIEMVYNSALDTESIEDREYAYGDANELSVTFQDNKMYAVWDASSARTYKLSVRNGEDITVIDESSPNYSLGKIDLSASGFNFNQHLFLYLDVTQTGLYSKNTKQIKYEYKGIDADTYDAYTKPVSAGFSEIDYYIANRAEWFRFWSYLVIFRENYKYDNGIYEVNSKVYMAYDYLSLYHTDDIGSAFGYEVYSAIDAYEDSAAYNYNYDVSDDGKIGNIYFKFLYDFDPQYTSSSGDTYVNATEKISDIHYSLKAKEEERTFPIDSVKKTVSVSSSDQLYFAIKMGYRPIPVPGSNADYLYERMRSILSLMLTDEMTDVQKVHAIYDYIVDTVVYDYDFTDNIYVKENISTNQLFSYRCLYMEGVFGLMNGNTFDETKRVAICDGLSKAFLCMAKIEGIECLKISGTVNGEGHAWNKVKIDSVWYMVDTTWGNNLDNNNNKEYLSHEYLLVPDDSRHEESEYINYPDATVRYNFGVSVDNDPTDDNIRNWFPVFPGRPRFSA